jgi:hypothetical protein
MRCLYLRQIYFFASIALLFCSCNKKYLREDRIPIGDGMDNAYVLTSKYINHNGNVLFMELDIGVVGTGYAIDVSYIPDSAFKSMNFPGHQLVVDSVQRIQLNENYSYSNLIALDVSEDWNEEDITNLRTRALNKTVLETLENPSYELAIGTYERDQGVKLYLNEGNLVFKQSYEAYARMLLDFTQLKGGTSNLFDAMDYYLNAINLETTHPKKYLTVVVRNGPDNLNVVTASQLITKAKSLGISINLIVLGGGTINQSLYSIAARTGGFLNVINNTGSYGYSLNDLIGMGTPMLGSIDRILSRNVYVYRLHVRLVKSTGYWASGSFVYDPYEVNLFEQDGSPWLNNLLPFYVQVP